MQEVFYEESVKCQNEKNEKVKYLIVFTLSILSFLFCVIFFFIMINFMNLNNHWLINIIFYGLPLVFFLVFGIVLLKLKNRFCVDYDYIFVSGSIRISKVINNALRQTIYRINTSQIEKIGPINSKIFNDFLNKDICKLKYLSSNKVPTEGKNFYYFVVNTNGEKLMLILECSKIFLINVLKYSNRTIRDEELK